MLGIEKRVGNKTQLPTNPDQVKFPEARRLDGRPNSSLQLPQKPRRKQNKEIKTSQN